jgi:hypothetical protein
LARFPLPRSPLLRSLAMNIVQAGPSNFLVSKPPHFQKGARFRHREWKHKGKTKRKQGLITPVTSNT